MKRIAFFCIPATGHTNPMLAVAKELVRRGNRVRFYSFDRFQDRIAATGAEYVSCDAFLPKLTDAEAKGLLRVSITEMTIQDIRATLAMDSFIQREFAEWKPDVIYTDSACFWGKLSAKKHGIPMVVSTSTFAFNQLSSSYMKNSLREIADMIFGLPRISKELKRLEPYGYRVRNALELVQSDDRTDSVVYTSRAFQPFGDVFSEHYAFVGPSLDTDLRPQKAKERPLVYVSMGTVLNDRPDFYRHCMDALGGEDVDVVISCGHAVDWTRLGDIPDNVSIYPSVNQLEVLSKADVFITHCGMNSVSESLYMATPMVLYPQTGEQFAVARRAAEIGAGVFLKDDSAAGILKCVREILNGESHREAAKRCGDDFRSCSGAVGAAEFIENAPHDAVENVVLKEMNRRGRRFQQMYWLIAAALLAATGTLVGWQFTGFLGAAAGIASAPVSQMVQRKIYKNRPQRG